MKKITILSITIFSVLLNACYTSKKTLRPVNVSINEDFQVTIEKDPKGHFLDYYTAEQYKETFMKGLISKLNLNNITVVKENAEFNIIIDKVVLTESLTTDTVRNVKSRDYRKVYDIVKGLVQCSGKVQSPDKSKSENFKVDKSERESLTPFFRPKEKTWDGREPEANDYRKKAFNSHEFNDMIYAVGSRTGDVSTNRVNKFMKK